MTVYALSSRGATNRVPSGFFRCLPSAEAKTPWLTATKENARYIRRVEDFLCLHIFTNLVERSEPSVAKHALPRDLLIANPSPLGRRARFRQATKMLFSLAGVRLTRAYVLLYPCIRSMFALGGGVSAAGISAGGHQHNSAGRERGGRAK